MDFIERIKTRAQARRLGGYLGERVRHGICELQNDFVVANASGATVRGDLNGALQSLATLSSGASAPTTTYAHMLWADTTSSTLKRRNAANTGWLVVRTLQEASVLARSSNTIVGVDDMGRTLNCTSTFTQTLTAAATLGDGFWFWIRNNGTGYIKIDPNGAETIDGAATITLAPGDSCAVLCNGTLFITVSRARNSTPAGVVMDYAGSSLPLGWLECDASAVSRTTYEELFAAIGTTWGAGDGSTTFNLPPGSGRSRIGRGTGTSTAAGVDADVDITANELVVATNADKWITGMLVTFTLTSGTVTGLTSGNPYYVIRMSTTRISLAATLADAENTVEIDFTAKSTPVWTISHTYSARTLGEVGGEEKHAPTIAETASHDHPYIGQGTNQTGANAGATDGGVNQSKQTSATGGGAAHNNMQPFAVFMTIIKT